MLFIFPSGTSSHLEKEHLWAFNLLTLYWNAAWEVIGQKLSSPMPNERKQLNKSHISVTAPLTDAIQEVGPISTTKHTESTFKVSYLAYLGSLWGSAVSGEKHQEPKMSCFNSCGTKELCVHNKTTVHIKWVKQTTECICILLFGSAAQYRFAVNEKHPHGPMTPKPFPQTGLLCKQA